MPTVGVIVGRTGVVGWCWSLLELPIEIVIEYVLFVSAGSMLKVASSWNSLRKSTVLELDVVDSDVTSVSVPNSDLDGIGV